MYRTAMRTLIEWKNNPARKPLIIEGARQVGKTWLMKEFGKTQFSDVVYVNFEANKSLERLFALDMDTKRLIEGLEIFCGHKIVAESTLLIFDEIQEVPMALTSLKYFFEEAPEMNIVCAGSLLGIALHSGTSFPVGKVDMMKLYPLTFTEFLMATGAESYAELLSNHKYDMTNVYRSTYIEALKTYYYVGGMPEAVLSYVSNKDYKAVRDIQKRILEAYEYDFSKHAPSAIVPRIRMVWNNIPSQLAKENKKFVYGLIREGSRAKDYETAIMWLIDCGLVYKISRIAEAHLPLKAYEDLKAFKLYLLDVGLLSCMVGIDKSVLLEGDEMFSEFKGSLTEQYVCQQLETIDEYKVCYYSNERGNCEVDFVIDDGVDIIPVEVKAEVNLKAKSLRTYRERYCPRMAIRTALTDYKVDDGLVNLPLYAVENLREKDMVSRSEI